MGVRQRRRAKPVNVAVNTDYSEQFPAALYRSINLKMSGIMAASGAGTNAGDGPFNLLGRVELVRGGDPIIAMHGADLRHLSAFLQGAQAEILPASISNGAAFLAQAELPLDKLISDAAIDCRREDLVVRGRFRGLTNLGTTVTAISSGKLRASGETTELKNGDHFEPRFSQQTIDCSAAGTELVTIKRIGSDVELATAIMLRVFDASTELSDPNAYRSDGVIREVRIEVERAGRPAEEVARYTWGELKQMSTSRYGVSSVSGQIASGVVLLTLDDPSTPDLDDALRLERGDAIIVRIDTAATIEDEFTALTPASGDLCYVTFLNFVPRGPGVDAIRAQRRG
jgi:hypothetical protein